MQQLCQCEKESKKDQAGLSTQPLAVSLGVILLQSCVNIHSSIPKIVALLLTAVCAHARADFIIFKV